MVKEAEQYAEEDRRRREEIELRNRADQQVYSAEKLLREYQDRIPEDLKQEVEAKIQALKDALQAGDVVRIRTALPELEQALQRIGLHMYGGVGAPGSAPSGEQGGGGGGEEGPIEGQFREV